MVPVKKRIKITDGGALSIRPRRRTETEKARTYLLKKKHGFARERPHLVADAARPLGFQQHSRSRLDWWIQKSEGLRLAMRTVLQMALADAIGTE